MAVLSRLLLAVAAIGTTMADSLAGIDHVVLFMQENRAFDHYYGTMAGVRGYSDPNVQINGDIPVWSQAVDTTLSPNATFLNPFYLNYLGDFWLNATQCMEAGSNGMTANQLALNEGLNNHWAIDNTPWSWGFFKRSDLPVHYAINDAWMIGDMYQEGVIASTNPNRVIWVSGTVNVSGNSPYLDNNETPGCQAPNMDCFPLTWKTIVEVMQEEGVNWQVYQDADNFDDLPMAWFKTFQDAPKDSELFIRGIQGLSLDSFYAQAANGTLPEVSYIIGPTTLSEHQPNRPIDGAFLQRKIIEAVATSPKYSKTVLMISYDETGGWGDHVEPYHSPTNTTGEWIVDPTPGIGNTFTGPGFRVPFTVVSPWTRGQLVYTGHADHNSQLLFLEEWFAARGKKVKTPSMEPWRRNHMSNLVDAFDFEHPDYSVPNLPLGVQPQTDATGNVNGTAICQAMFHTTRPPVPFDAAFGSVATDNVASLSENGFKAMRGMLTEGRFLVMEMGKNALTVKPNCKGKVQAAPAAANHDDITQRWVAHVEQIGGDQFRFSSAKDGRFLKSNGRMVAPSGTKNVGDLFTVRFKPSNGYSLENSAGQFLAISGGKVVFVDDPAYFSLFSVTFDH